MSAIPPTFLLVALKFITSGISLPLLAFTPPPVLALSRYSYARNTCYSSKFEIARLRFSSILDARRCCPRAHRKIQQHLWVLGRMCFFTTEDYSGTTHADVSVPDRLSVKHIPLDFFPLNLFRLLSVLRPPLSCTNFCIKVVMAFFLYRLLLGQFFRLGPDPSFPPIPRASLAYKCVHMPVPISQTLTFLVPTLFEPCPFDGSSAGTTLSERILQPVAAIFGFEHFLTSLCSKPSLGTSFPPHVNSEAEGVIPLMAHCAFCPLLRTLYPPPFC